jgi:hypothetical protein
MYRAHQGQAERCMHPQSPKCCLKHELAADVPPLPTLSPPCPPSPPPGLPRFSAYVDALLAHPAVSGSMVPPDSSRSYFDQLLDTYKEYVARRKAAAN